MCDYFGFQYLKPEAGHDEAGKLKKQVLLGILERSLLLLYKSQKPVKGILLFQLYFQLLRQGTLGLFLIILTSPGLRNLFSNSSFFFFCFPESHTRDSQNSITLRNSRKLRNQFLRRTRGPTGSTNAFNNGFEDFVRHILFIPQMFKPTSSLADLHLFGSVKMFKVLPSLHTSLADSSVVYSSSNCQL